MGVGSLVSDLVVWGFRAIIFTCLATAITILVMAARLSHRVKIQSERLCEPIEWNTRIDQPDDVAHPYSLTRAWDRHLISIGLDPIGGGTPEMLSWKVSGPDAEVWWIDGYGRADTRPYKTLLEGRVRKGSDPPEG